MKGQARGPGEAPRITVSNRQRAVSLRLDALQRFASRALTKCLEVKQRRGGVLRAIPKIAVTLVSDRRMATLHRKFLGLSGPTDVITFQHGEIAISADTACRNAQEFGTSSEREVQLYIVHGLLHLHGFDDTNAATARVMKCTQNRIVKAAVADLEDCRSGPCGAVNLHSAKKRSKPTANRMSG
ncbi:MAG: rRNA maturation RNase YbeY [Chthoniobacterales bacterium]